MTELWTQEQIDKLNKMIEEGLSKKPDSFFLEDSIERWWYSMRVEVAEDIDDGVEYCDFILQFYSTMYEGKGDELPIIHEGDNPEDIIDLGETFEEASNKLKSLIPDLRSQKHVYHG